MATTSTQAAWRNAFVTAMVADAALGAGGVDVVHTPERELRSEAVWLGKTTDNSVNEYALKAGRRRRDETYEVEVMVRVSSKKTSAANETRAMVLTAAIEDLLADDPKTGSVDGVLYAWVTGTEMDTGYIEKSATTEVKVTVEVRARLQ